MTQGTHQGRYRAWARFVLMAAGAAVLLANLYGNTRGLRLATADDFSIAKGAADTGAALGNRIGDFKLGRFYADLKFAILETLARTQSDSVHAWLRIGFFLAAVLAAAWFAAALGRDRGLFLRVVCGLIGLAPVSLGYQALLSVPTLWIGWAAVWSMGALALQRDTIEARAATLLAFALALVVHESNAIFVVWPALVRWCDGAPFFSRRNLSEAAAMAFVAAIYAAFALSLRHAAAADVQGSGYSFAFNLRAFPFALNVYTLSGVPGLPSWLRPLSPSGAPWLGPRAWLLRTFANATLPGVIGSVLLGWVTWVAARSSPVRFAPRVACALIFAAFAPNVLISLTVKYQIWAHQRMWPYYYTSMSYLAWCVLLALLVPAVACRLRHPAGRGAFRVLLAAIVALAALGIHASNGEAAGLMRQHPMSHMIDYREWLSTRENAPRASYAYPGAGAQPTFRQHDP